MDISTLPLNRQAPGRGQLGYPARVSEFEIHAYLYVKLKTMGYDVRGEVCGHANHRFDLVIFGPEKNAKGRTRIMPVRIIEVKRGRCTSKPTTRSGKQVCGYYERYGVPVDLVGGLKEAKAYVEIIRSIIPLPSGAAPSEAWAPDPATAG